MFDLEKHFTKVVGRGFDATPQKKERKTPKQLILNKLDTDLAELKGITDIDDLGYGNGSNPYTNKKGVEVTGRMKSWSGRTNAKGMREVRVVMGTSIVFDSNSKKMQFAVEDTISAVRDMMQTLRGGVESMSEMEWEEIATHVAKVNKERRERKAANKQIEK